MLLINQVVSYLSVAFYVIKPSTQQISHLIAKQVELALPTELEPPLAAALSAQLQQKTGVKLYTESEALQHGLAEATYYGYFSQQLSDALRDRDLARLVDLFRQMRGRFGQAGPWLFGDWSIADAFFTPVAARIRHFQLDLAAHGDDGTARAYAETLLAHPHFREWEADALGLTRDNHPG